jgi:hypothetical protein
MNSVRVWGGGVFLPEMFYDVCDELGLVIALHGAFACEDEPDNVFAVLCVLFWNRGCAFGSFGFQKSSSVTAFSFQWRFLLSGA